MKTTKKVVKTTGYAANPSLMSKPKAALPKLAKIRVVKTVKKTVPAMKRYGDKAYKPSNGKGVGN